MSKYCLALLVTVIATPVLAQTPAPPAGTVKVTRVLDNEQTAVRYVEIQANATRPMHSHPEAVWHIFMTTDAPMDLLIEGEPTVHLGPYQAHFFKGGTMHGFSNPNARPAHWIEMFALKAGNAVAMDESAGRALALSLAEAYRGASPVSLPPGVVAEPMKKLRPSFSLTD